MTTQSLSLDDGVPDIKNRVPIVQIQELPLCSPSTEKGQNLPHGVVEIVGKTSDCIATVDSTKILLDGLALKRPQSGGQTHQQQQRPGAKRRSSSMGSFDTGEMDEDCGFIHQQFLMALHKTRSVDNSGSHSARAQKARRDEEHSNLSARRHESPEGPAAASLSLHGHLPPRDWLSRSQTLESVLSRPSGVIGPLTPPEDIDAFKWESPLRTEAADGVRQVPTAPESQSQSSGYGLQRTSSSSRPSEIQMPEPSGLTGGDSNRPNWLGRACQKLGG
jgi:hypothetical protein